MERLRTGIPVVSVTQQHWGGLGRLLPVEDTEAFMRIMSRRVLLPRVVACCCRKIARQWSLPLLQCLWPPLHYGKEILTASGHAAPRQQGKNSVSSIFNDMPMREGVTGTVCACL